MTPDQQSRLAAELRKPAYDSKARTDAYNYLLAPRVISSTVATGFLLTPVAAARLLGPTVANAIAAAAKGAFPAIADHLMTAGIDPTDPNSAAFFAQLQAGGVLTADQVTLIAAQCNRTETQTQAPRWYDVFAGVAGMPNTVDTDEFAAAWTAAGRS